MLPDAVRFDAVDLARQIETLSQYQLDTLSFGVILIDRDGTIVFYSQTEARQSGYGEIPIGRNMFEISPCMSNNDFRGRIKRAMDEGPVDLEFGWAGDFADPTRDCGCASCRRAITASGFSSSATASAISAKRTCDANCQAASLARSCGWPKSTGVPLGTIMVGFTLAIE
jgi:photoactive yellow protein